MDSLSHKVILSSAKAKANSVFTQDRLESTDSMETRQTTVRSFDISKTIEERIFTKRDYLVFAIAFALTEAPVVAILTFSPVLLSSVAVGGWGNGVFYISFAMCSVTTSKSIVQTFGCKNTLVYGYLGTAVYIFGWGVCSSLIPGQMYYAFPIVSAIGGISQAIMYVCKTCSFSFSNFSNLIGVQHR